jgi:mannose-6-phosphate isomerase-like protein (cupin superfamily)
MTATFRPVVNRATGEWIQYTAVTDDGDGDDDDGGVVRFDWRTVPGSDTGEHVHPHQQERFTVLSGTALFTVDGEQRLATAGETITVPAGTPHAATNPGPADLQGVVEIRPALHSKEMFEALAGLAAEGRTTSRGAPRNPLHLGATFWHFRHESRPTSPPLWAQTLLLGPLAGLARILGVRPYYDRWDSRAR